MVLPTLAPFVMMLGAANGMSTLARASSVAQIFGPRHYGAISGAIALGANGARAVGPVGASLLVVALGSYGRVFWALAASLVVVSVAVAMTGTELARREAAVKAPRRAPSPRAGG
jgi:MFS family permease